MTVRVQTKSWERGREKERKRKGGRAIIEGGIAGEISPLRIIKWQVTKREREGRRQGDKEGET